jgi:hypothetical protein
MKSEIEIMVVACATCFVPFGISAELQEKRQNDHEAFYCPSGHDNYYSGPSQYERRAKEAEQAQLAAQAKLNEERHLRLVAENALKKETQKRKKIEKRIAAGVCPCCNRTFEDLQKHMQTKHKGYAPIGSGSAGSLTEATKQ